MCPGAQALPEELSPRLWAFFRAGETGVTKCRPPWGPSTAARGLWGGGGQRVCVLPWSVSAPPPAPCSERRCDDGARDYDVWPDLVYLLLMPGGFRAAGSVSIVVY
jgi:hypothetical protein